MWWSNIISFISQHKPKADISTQSLYLQTVSQLNSGMFLYDNMNQTSFSLFHMWTTNLSLLPCSTAGCWTFIQQRSSLMGSRVALFLLHVEITFSNSLFAILTSQSYIKAQCCAFVLKSTSCPLAVTLTLLFPRKTVWYFSKATNSLRYASLMHIHRRKQTAVYLQHMRPARSLQPLLRSE